jgi:hypothetical protein
VPIAPALAAAGTPPPAPKPDVNALVDEAAKRPVGVPLHGGSATPAIRLDLAGRPGIAPAANVVMPAASSLSSREDSPRGESELRADPGALAFDFPPYSITEATFTMQ